MIKQSRILDLAMGSSVLWVVVEHICRILGISTAAVLCAVGVETLHHTDFYSLAVYLLVSSAGTMLFEMTYFIDAFMVMRLQYSVTSKFLVIWKKMANVGSFQKFLYYTFMSVMCFLHPVLVWHAVIPGMMLLLTGLLNCYLSKKTKKSPSKGFGESFKDLTMCISKTEETEPTYCTKKASYLPNNSRLNIDCSEAMLGPGHSMWHIYNPQNKAEPRNIQFSESLKDDDTEMVSFDMDPEETISDTVRLIKNGSGGCGKGNGAL